MITFDKKNLIFLIVQLGVGGNGGYVVQQVAQMMSTFGIPGRYILADPDVVESHNLKNQLFIPHDLGEKKATVLSSRYGSHYQQMIASYTESYVEDITTLQKLFKQSDYIGSGYFSRNSVIVPTLIGCVDNNYTRKIMHEFFMTQDRLLYIDVGVEATKVPQDDRKVETWTEGEQAAYKASGWTGQVVCGLRWDGDTILEPVAGRFPDILEDDDQIAPSETACSNVVAKEPQRLITNRYASLAVANYLNELFGEHTISNHVTFITAKSKTQLRNERVEKSISL